MAELEGGEYVLLGTIDEAISSPKSFFSVNKIGGSPDFDKNHQGNPLCGICGKVQLFVVQVYCPLDDSRYHRVLYIFCCLNASCWSNSRGWTAIRLMVCDGGNTDVKYESKPRDNQKSSSTMDAGWGGDDNDWGECDDNWGLPEVASRCARGEKVVIDDPVGNQPDGIGPILNGISCVTIGEGDSEIDGWKDCGFSACHNDLSLKSYYVNVFEEGEYDIGCKEVNTGMSSEASLNDAGTYSHSSFGDICKLQPEPYERSEHSDDIFHKFWKKNRICPEQVIRYSYQGSPLHARKMTEKVPHCFCGAPRVYEMQLMPALLPHLVLNDTSIEFSTVLIYTCSANCLKTDRISFLKEHVVYQDDPDLSYFKGQKS